jgi:hypothetical protein
MVGYHDPLPGPLNLTNNGHSGTVLQHNLIVTEICCKVDQPNYLAALNEIPGNVIHVCPLQISVINIKF